MRKTKRFLLVVPGLILLAYAAVFGYHYYYYSIASSINEPVFTGPQTQYCWLVFGREGKTRILVRRSGMGIAVDADGNGSFGWKERFASAKDCNNIVIAGSDGKTEYRIANVELQRFNETPWSYCTFDVEIHGPCDYVEQGRVDMAQKSLGASELHFDNGDLAFYDNPNLGIIFGID